MLNIAMWGKALRVIPRISEEEWRALDLVSRWLVATRAAVFVMTAISCAIGGLLAYAYATFSWPYFIACMVGLVFAHATNNLVNDFTDHVKGVDKDNYFRAQYGPQTLEHGLLSKRQLMGYVAASGAVALAAGAFLVWHTGWVTLALLGAGAFFVLFYTWPLKYIGMGEPAVLLVWGPLMVGGTYFVVSGGHWSWDVAAISIAYALGPTTVLFGKHTDKLEQDRAKGIRTLPTIIGEKAARYSVIGMWVAQFALVVGLVAVRAVGPALLLVLLALPSLFKVAPIFLEPRPTARPADFSEDGWPLYLVAYAFLFNRRFGGLFIAALVLEVVLRKAGVY